MKPSHSLPIAPPGSPLAAFLVVAGKMAPSQQFGCDGCNLAVAAVDVVIDKGSQASYFRQIDAAVTLREHLATEARN